MATGTFATAINCMDGRTQLPVIEEILLLAIPFFTDFPIMPAGLSLRTIFRKTLIMQSRLSLPRSRTSRSGHFRNTRHRICLSGKKAWTYIVVTTGCKYHGFLLKIIFTVA